MPKKKSEVVQNTVEEDEGETPPAAFIALIKNKRVAEASSKEGLQKALGELSPKKLATISIYTYIPAKVQVAVEW